MAYYILREAQITAADTKTALTGQGSESSPGALTVPGDAHKIVEIIAAVASSLAAGAATYFLRIGGSAVQGGEQQITIAAEQYLVSTSGAVGGAKAPIRIPVDIDVVPNNTITLHAEMSGSDMGTAECAVTLVLA